MIKRKHFIIIISILLIGFIIGSFFDLPIDQALYNKNDFVGILFACFGTYPCYIGMAFIGGALLLTSLKANGLPLWGKIVGLFLSALAYVLSIVTAAKDLPSVNGFNDPNLMPISYIICITISTITYVLAILVCRNKDHRFLWNILIVMAVIYIIGMIPVSYIIKALLHRPRYRFLVRGEITPFCSWWESCTNYKDFLDGSYVFEGITIGKEEFKSFPSGHSGAGAIMMMFLPFLSFFFDKLKGKETLLFYVGFVWTLVCMFYRLRLGAHYLTDTCMGSLIVVVIFFITYEFAKNMKVFTISETKKEN